MRDFLGKVGWLLALFSSTLLTACLQDSHGLNSNQLTRSADFAYKDIPGTRVVIGTSALSNANFYHDYFYAGSVIYEDSEPSAVDDTVLQEFGISNDQILYLTRTGDLEADLLVDAGQWAKVGPNKYYWVAGTNIIFKETEHPDGRRFQPPPALSGLELGDGGSVTSQIVGATLTGHNQSIVLVVGSVSSLTIALDPHVDIVLLGASAPQSVLPAYPTGYFDSAYDLGKIHVAPVGDDARFVSSIYSPVAGPWWVWSVGGYEEGEREGYDSDQAHPLDFVADNVLPLPICGRCESGLEYGLPSNFIAHAVAGGVISKVLLRLRQEAAYAGGIVITNEGPKLIHKPELSFSAWELRRFIEEAVVVPDSSEFDPLVGAGEFQSLDPASPVDPVAPFTRIGWGLLSNRPDRDPVPEVLDRAFDSGHGYADKPGEQCRYQSAYMQARRAYWSNGVVRNGDQEEIPIDPYVYCNG